MSEDGFLSRWAKRKALVQKGVAVEPEAAPPDPLPTSARGEAREPAPGAPGEGEERPTPTPLTDQPPKTLADVAALTPDADFTPFLSPQVEEHVKQAALKKLFADPHFNLMDGLDTYIDDYSKPDPIPESMLRRMAQSKALGLFDDADDAGDKQRQNLAAPPSLPADADAQAAPALTDPEASPDGAAATDLTQSATAPQAVPRHEDPDLRLQQDDAAGPGGSREGAAG